MSALVIINSKEVTIREFINVKLIQYFMDRPVIIPQIEFENLDDFISLQNNYYAHFLGDCEWGQLHREMSHFRRFQKAHPKMEREATSATIQAVRRGPIQKLPYEQLWETYKIMSKLVFTNDEYLMQDDPSNEFFLVR